MKNSLDMDTMLTLHCTATIRMGRQMSSLIGPWKVVVQIKWTLMQVKWVWWCIQWQWRGWIHHGMPAGWQLWTFFLPKGLLFLILSGHQFIPNGHWKSGQSTLIKKMHAAHEQDSTGLLWACHFACLIIWRIFVCVNFNWGQAPCQEHLPPRSMVGSYASNPNHSCVNFVVIHQCLKLKEFSMITIISTNKRFLSYFYTSTAKSTMIKDFLIVKL